MGILGSVIAGAGEGLGVGVASAGKRWSEAEYEKDKAEALAQRQESLARLTAKLGQETHAANIETDIAARPRMGAAETGVLKERQSALLPGKIEEHRQIAAVDTEQKVQEFTKLEPLKRKSMIDTAVEQLRALSTPEMLRAERSIAQAKHIVDPSYTAVPNADGTVTMVNVRNPKDTKTLEVDGKPVVRKDPEELKAATSVINMASANLRIAQAEHKAAMADIGADPAAKAAANAAWANAQTEAKRLTAPAYAVLYGKAGIPDTPASDVVAPPAGGGRPPIDSFFRGKQPPPPSSSGAAAVPARQPGIVDSQVSGSTPSNFAVLDPGMQDWERRQKPKP